MAERTLAGSEVGPYRLVSQLGAGGMGVVWLGEHKMLGRRAAVKLLRKSFTEDDEIVSRFFNEARAATAISDPGIVQIFDFGYHADGSAYIVMELLEGEPLDKRLARRGKLSTLDALRTTRQVASSLGAAHARGIIHRDLKPENVFLVRDAEVAGGERAKILDFGIAKLSDDRASAYRTNTAALMGTPMYMSPEQCRGAGGVDLRSDIYSLGCLLYALLTGRPPFPATGVGEVIAKHLTEPPPRAGISPRIDALLMRCMAKDPGERFQTCGDLAAALEVELAGEVQAASAAVASRSSGTLGPHIGARAASQSEGRVRAQGTGQQPVASDTAEPSRREPAAALSWTRAESVVEPRSQPAWSPTAPSAYVPAVSAPYPPGHATTLSSASGVREARGARGVWLAPLALGVVGVAGLATWLALRDHDSHEPAPAAAPVDAPAPAVDPQTVQRHAVEQQLTSAVNAFLRWAASHPGADCPTLAAIGDAGIDPWQHPLVLTCKDQPADQIVGAISLGPDGKLDTGDDVTSWSLVDVASLAKGPRWQVAKHVAKSTKPVVTPVAPAAAPAPPPVVPASPPVVKESVKKGPSFRGTVLGPDGIPVSR